MATNASGSGFTTLSQAQLAVQTAQNNLTATQITASARKRKGHNRGGWPIPQQHDLRAAFTELARGNALARAYIALDFFDASINRIAAYVIDIRATRKAILHALLDPTAKLQALERDGRAAYKLALMERVKTLPFGEVWDELCRRADAPSEADWVREVERYEKRVLTKRT